MLQNAERDPGRNVHAGAVNAAAEATNANAAVLRIILCDSCAVALTKNFFDFFMCCMSFKITPIYSFKLWLFCCTRYCTFSITF